MTIPILVIVGPTAVGKTRIAIELAKELNGEIISADSRQIYKGMDIGTAKPSEDEQAAVKHHMIDIINPDEPFSVGEYKRSAERIIEDIWQRNRLPIIAGGTGLYIKAVIDGLWEGPKADKELRDKLKKKEEAFGSGCLYKKLKEVDPATAKKTKPNDLARIIRSLEVYYKEGKPISYFHKIHGMNQNGSYHGFKEKKYNVMFIGLTMERKALYKRIEERVDEMLNSGLIDEVKALLKKGYDDNIGSMTGVGYRQVIGYLRGEYDLEEAVRLIKRDTKRYAKRQYTWFNKDKRIEWFNINDIDIKAMASGIKKRLKLREK